ncbi:MAG: MATE family efflux transporter [Spirochaetaceae bacterium]|nr:MAG: MATE family efflux transporter [Spirochaetaceae bacterium]
MALHLAKRLDMLGQPVPRLVRSLAIPASIGMIFNTLYNVVDTYYGQFLATEGLAALSLSFPLFFVIIAAGSGVATGSTALISNALGRGDEERAVHLQAQAVSFGILMAIVLTAIGLAVAPAAYRFMGATDAVLVLALQYIRVILFGTVFFLLNQIINAGLSSRGDSKSLRNALFIGLLLNIALDPLLLFGFAPIGIPAMGAAGIALATVLIQGISVVYMSTRARAFESFAGASLRDFVPKIRTFREIAGQGIPASLNMMTVALGMFIINFFIARAGSTAGLAAYGVALRIEQIALLPSIGLNTAILAIGGNNFGAGRMDRVRETYRVALRYGFFLMVGLLAIILPLAGRLMAVFTGDPEVIAIGRQYLYIAGLVYYAYVILFSSVSLMQGMKRPMPALWIGLYRQLLAPVLVFYLFSEAFGWGLLGIWWGIFTVTWSAAIVALWLARRDI